MKTLIQWIIEQIDGKSYRAGKASGYHHPKVDNKLLQQIGGRSSLITQAKAIEKDPILGVDGKIVFDWWKMDSEIKTIHFTVDIMPELCRREGIEDSRIRQLRYIELLQEWKKRAETTWLSQYYEDEIRKLEEGNLAQTTQDNLEDGYLYRCLDTILHLKEPVEKPIFSARVFRDVIIPGAKITPSKIFRKAYESKVLSVLKHYSPACAEGMTDDEVLAAHGILSYAQTLEWKGPFIYQLNTDEEIDASGNLYGTIINAQTLEHALPKRLPGVKKIFTIENKANYEKQKFREDELYIFCHGFFSPKEVRFLRRITEAAEEGTEYYHWGDLDYGGIRIFQFNKEHVFPELKPYKMGRDDYEAALAAGAGVAIEEDKRKKCEKMDAGELEELKACILEYGLEIEQELLV